MNEKLDKELFKEMLENKTPTPECFGIIEDNEALILSPKAVFECVEEYLSLPFIEDTNKILIEINKKDLINISDLLNFNGFNFKVHKRMKNGDK